MKLFLHIGTEKTGSSFLQKICGHNRTVLANGGIWFPYAGKHEARLMSGSISPGNAIDLSRSIVADDWGRVADWIERRAYDAESNDCGSLLLSNEVLFASLSTGEAVSRFVAAVQRIGIDDISAMLFIRDPVEQALSLFKHRAKYGRVDDVKAWVESSYDLPVKIELLLKNVDETDLLLAVRKYSKDSATLLNIYFSEWLNFDSPLRIPEEVVNPSLTLAELRLLHYIARVRPNDVDLFYSELLAVPRESKASDDHLESAAREVLSRKLCDFDSIWCDLDRRLERDGGIAIPRHPSCTVPQDQSYSLNNAQLEAVARAHGRSLSLKHQLKIRINVYVRRPLGRIVRKVKESASR